MDIKDGGQPDIVSHQITGELIMSPGVPHLETPATVTTALGEDGDSLGGQVIQARITEPGVMRWELNINNKKFWGQIYLSDKHRRVMVIDMGMMQPGDSLLPPICFINEAAQEEASN